MLMWATKAEDLNLEGYVTEWDSELRHAAVRGKEGGKSAKTSPPQRFLHACGPPRANGAGRALFYVCAGYR